MQDNTNSKLHTDQIHQGLPILLLGPMIRYATPEQVNLFLVTSTPVNLQVKCFHGNHCIHHQQWSSTPKHYVPLGTHAHVYLLPVIPDNPFPADTLIEYDIGFETTNGTQWLKSIAPDTLYEGLQRPGLVIKSHIDQILHGSCRKPHYDGDDGLLLVDSILADTRSTYTNPDDDPTLLLMSGDQIYADDVAGPMLHAIHQVISLLGLYDEALEGAKTPDSQSMYRSTHSFYQRAELLPDTQANVTLRERFFAGAKKPIFTTANADNHLITLAEITAMYLLVWSPQLWSLVDLNKTDLAPQFRGRYDREQRIIEQFAKGLDKVQRTFANIPVYMIFDDHDITDDWNLTRGWEESAYEHPFSRRIIGNALIGYALFQAWGNVPDSLPDTLLTHIKALSDTPRNGSLETVSHNALITELLKFEGWQYTVDTQPKIVVLDTRTRRWRSERDMAKPSGLMDWEALTELQQALIHEKSVILVSPAPIFGVKLIETVQRIFTWFGHSLTVDAENWMSHPGAANVILNIFRHKNTPHHFVILSGDVHYSFAYDVCLRHRENSPHIWQITSSGIKNMFPPKLLRPFDRLNRWLFASYSPLNWLTRRRHMRIKQRRPSDHAGRYRHQRLVNGCSIGRVRFDEGGSPVAIETLLVSGESIGYTEGYESDWVD